MKIHVDGKEITLKSVNDHDYISLTDMVGDRSEAKQIIINWMRTYDTIDFLGEWETVHNPDFNLVESHTFRNRTGSVRLTLSPKQWIEKTGAIGIISKSGRYGGTYAHPDIAFEFGTRISARFKVLLIKEFQRLKQEEQKRLNEGWDVRRFLAKINYGIQTEMINRNILPRLEKGEKQYVFANEADLLNVAVFGMTAKEFREQFPKEKGNLRDNATIYQLTVLSNLESINAHLIESGASQEARFLQLAKIAAYQIDILSEDRRLEE